MHISLKRLVFNKSLWMIILRMCWLKPCTKKLDSIALESQIFIFNKAKRVALNLGDLDIVVSIQPNSCLFDTSK